MRSSIIVPTFNAASMLAETLDSIISELTDIDEIVIVDDGSTDNTRSVVEPYLCPNIRYFFLDNSGGPASPRNLGIEKARGEYLFLFDSDDLMLPGKLSAAFSAIEGNPEAGLIFTNFRTISESGTLLKARFLDDYELIQKLYLRSKGEEGYRIEAPQAYLHLARENFIGTSGVVVPADVFQRLGGFDTSLKNGDDRDMWFRITREYPVVYLPDEYHCYRIRSNSISMGSANKRVGSKLRVLERQLENPINNEFADDIRHLLSENYHSLAYEAFAFGEMKTAREYLASAIAMERNTKHLVLYAKTLLGRKGVQTMRRLKNSLRK